MKFSNWQVMRHTRSGKWHLLFEGEVNAIFATEEEANNSRWSELSEEERQSHMDEIDLDNDMQAEYKANRRLSYTA